MSVIKSLFIACLLICSFGFATPTPTEVYLQTHNLEDIKYSSPLQKQFEELLPLLSDIAAAENQEGFFGYHGCSQNCRLFQDILRAVFEEKLSCKIPEDFQFLRIPGDELFNLKDNAASFYTLFDRKMLTREAKETILFHLLIAPFNAQFNTAIQLQNLTESEINTLWSMVEEFLGTLDTLAIESYFIYKELFDSDVSSGSSEESYVANDSFEGDVDTPKRASIFKLEQMINSARGKDIVLRSYSGKKAVGPIYTVLQQFLPPKHNFTDTPIIKRWLRHNMKFQHIYNSITNTSEIYNNSFLWYFFFPYNDTLKEQQSRLVCINVPLYGNYYRYGEYTVGVFLSGRCISGGDTYLIELLNHFFKQIGLEEEGLPQKLYTIGFQELQNINAGCLLQFFDLSLKKKAAYQGLNEVAYVSYSYGIPIKSIKPSELVLNLHPIFHPPSNADLQMRLVASNYTTLNPYGFLRMKRYDTLDPAVSKAIIKKMRKALKNTPVNAHKLHAYEKRIKAIWHEHTFSH